MSEKPLIPMNNLRKSWVVESEEIASVLGEVVASGYWIHGPQHKAFEIELGAFLDSEHCFGVASGTDALEIALRAVGCKVGSKIIAVANAGGYAAIAAASIGCEVIYCDIDDRKLLMDPASLSPLLSDDVEAVVVTHLYGNVAPIGEIRELCEPYGIKVIEDCAQAIGASENGVRVGSIGHVGTFSFYPTKNLGAIGDGGALITSDREIAQKIFDLRQYGWSSKYKIDLPGGMNSRLDEIQAAVLRVGLPKLEFANQKRLDILEDYSEAIKGSDLRFVTSFEFGNVAHLAVILIPEYLGRERFRKHMQDRGIQTDIHYPILDFDQKGLKAPISTNHLKQSQLASDLIVSIPLFPELSAVEISQISNALNSFN